MSVRWKMLLRTLTLTCLAALVAAINGCEGWTPADTQVPKPLRVVALRDPLTRLRPGEGLEYDLLWHFAQSNRVPLVWKWVKTPDEILHALNHGEADLAAGRLSADFFMNSFTDSVVHPASILTTAYEHSDVQLVCTRDWRSETELSFLEHLWKERAGAQQNWIERKQPRIALDPRDGSRIAHELAGLQPGWKLQMKSGSLYERAHRLLRGKADCLVTDASSAAWIVNAHPDLRIVRELPIRLARAFVFAPGRASLEAGFTSWYQARNRAGFVQQIRNRYFGFQKSLTDADRRALIRARAQELPELMPRFRRLAAEFNLPWALLAAVAYQESHWNNEAESHTGVRGIMQLTKETAQHLGVDDREDLEQSIWGGAKYLREILNKQPASLHPRERLALALAAYNVGLGHLRDAQKLAVAQGRSPMSFWDLRLVLPLLSNPAIASGLDYGSARGDEPVQFTDRVLAFYDLLSQ